MKFVLEDFMAEMKELKDQMFSMQSKHADLEYRLSEEHKLRKSAERKIKSKAKTDDSDRQKEKEDYDGTDDTLRTDSVDHNPSQEVKDYYRIERDLSKKIKS